MRALIDVEYEDTPSIIIYIIVINLFHGKYCAILLDFVLFHRVVFAGFPYLLRYMVAKRKKVLSAAKTA